MNDALSLHSLRLLIATVKAQSVKPRILQTQDEVDRANETDRQIGLNRPWRVGDSYYNVSDFMR